METNKPAESPSDASAPDTKEAPGDSTKEAVAALAEPQAALLAASAAAPVSSRPDKPPPLPYKKPSWSSTPKFQYSLEVLKNGSIIDSIDISKEEFYVIGRLPICDIPMDHPSVSRYHVVIQHSDDGHVYVNDLGSTHGTKLNKNSVTAKKFYRLHYGQMLRIGGSSRMYILVGSDEVAKEEEKRLVEEEDKFRSEQETIQAKLAERKAAREAAAKEREQAELAREEEGVSWGMAEDATEEDEEQPMQNTDAAILSQFAGGHTDDGNTTDFYSDDPKKYIRAYFEQHGGDLDYETSQTGPGHARVYAARLLLPIDGVSGEPVYAVAEAGKKRDAVKNCALAACKLLDRRGLLRSGKSQKVVAAEKRKKVRRASDDEDDFYDRTGDLERKKKEKAKRASKNVQNLTSLTAKKIEITNKLLALGDQLKMLESQLAAQAEQEANEGEKADALDLYMSKMSTTKADKKTVKKIKGEMAVLTTQLKETESFINLVKPALDPLQIAQAEAPKPEQDNKPAAEGGTADKRNEKPTSVDSRIDHTHHVRGDARVVQPPPAQEEKSETPAVKSKRPVFAAPAPRLPNKSSISTNLQDAKPQESQTATTATSNNKRKDKRKVGVLLPPGDDGTGNHVEDDAGKVDANDEEEEEPKPGLVIRKKRKRIRKHVPKPKPIVEEPRNDSIDHEADSVWVPPVGQKGDGRTALNDKLGY